MGKILKFKTSQSLKLNLNDEYGKVLFFEKPNQVSDSKKITTSKVLSIKDYQSKNAKIIKFPSSLTQNNHIVNPKVSLVQLKKLQNVYIMGKPDTNIILKNHKEQSGAFFKKILLLEKEMKTFDKKINFLSNYFETQFFILKILTERKKVEKCQKIVNSIEYDLLSEDDQEFIDDSIDIINEQSKIINSLIIQNRKKMMMRKFQLITGMKGNQ